MADTKSEVVLFSGTTRYIKLLNYEYVDVGESTPVQKINISALLGAPAKVHILKVDYSISVGMSVGILFDHTTDDLVLNLTGNGSLDFTNGEIVDPASAGDTGDIMFSTVGDAVADTYSIKIEIGW